MTTQTKAKILEYIASKGKASPTELARFLNIGLVATHRHLKKLVASNQLTKTGSPPRVLYSSPQTTDPQLNAFIKRLIAHYRPEKIVLFGSRASGRIHPDSDIDLLIVKNTPDRYWDRIKRVIPLLRGMPPVDLFILTPNEISRAIADNRYFLTKEILPKGVTLYDRAS